MSTQFCVTKAQFHNAYFINGAEVEKIHFFDEGKIIATNPRGWLPLPGNSNNDGNNVIEAIEFTRKRKIVLDAEFSFFVGDELYMWIGDCPEFEYLGERVAFTQKDCTYYGIYISFQCGGTAGTYTHIDRVENREFMLGPYSRSVKTNYGEKLAAVVTALGEVGVDISSYKVEKMTSNLDAILTSLEALRGES